jgi:hypothetical protein
MSSGEFERSSAPALTALPTLDQLRRSGTGFDEESVREAFDSFRRHTTQLHAQLRVLQAARTTTAVDPTGHAVRMDSLHLIRAAAEFADVLERDAQNASATQLKRTEEEVRAKQRELQDREAEIDRFRNESERQRAEILNAAKAEARDLLSKAHSDATRELRDSETRGNRLLEQSRHQATELTNSARAEVEQTLEWARAQAGAVMARAQKGAEQLLAAAGLGEPALTQVVDSILTANERESERAGTPVPPRPAAPAPAPEPVSSSQRESRTVAETAPPVTAAEPPVSAPPVSEPPVTAPPSERPTSAAPASADLEDDEPDSDDEPGAAGEPDSEK